MRGHRVIVAICLLLGSMAPAYAFLGIGDVSFDPAAHLELVKLYAEGLRLYHVALEQLRRERDIARAIRSAQRDRRAIRHSDFGALLHDSDRLISAAQAVSGTDIPTAGFRRSTARYLRRSKTALQSLSKLHSAAVAGLQALDGLSPGTRRSESVIARATSLLAALATAHAERGALKRVAEHAAAALSHDRLRRVETVYRSMGLRAW
ncbi:MAG: hypothetical protein ACYCQK_08000 [Acidiferrobacteraceae bacterium]